MKGAEALLEVGGRAVQHADLVYRQIERLGRDLRADRLEPLADVRRADVYRGAAAPVELDARVLPRPGGAAFDEARHGDPVVAAVDQLPLEVLLLFKIEFKQAAIER